MPELSGIYDSATIQPVAKIKENLSIWTLGRWQHYKIEFLEPIPPGPASIVEMVSLSGATRLAGAGTIAKRIIQVLQLNDYEFVHLRWEPLDNVEGVLWEQAGQARFFTANIHARVDRNTRLWDPNLTSTTFWVLGRNRDMNLEVRNPLQYAIAIARFIFFGYRMILVDIDLSGVPSPDKAKLEKGDLDTVRKYIGATTWLPAEGKTA